MVLIDQSETGIFELECEIEANTPKIQYQFVVADITNPQRIEQLFLKYHPDVIFHAAAYKHVPIMEKNPSEAILCNVLGTKYLADLSFKFMVKKFVMISTDKAVNPTNVMGASKRIAEMYVQSLNNFKVANKEYYTKFVTTRFGNVLGSNGSVIPLFKKQIDKGGPITVTHPDITRYFMTISEAVELVLEAASMGEGGEIYLFDMGESVKIVDLAKRMIHLSGLELNKDIEIHFTGLREGEKLYEELLNNKENTISTYHEKIMIAKVVEYAYMSISREIDKLIDLAKEKDEFEVVTQMKKMVPEYLSSFSRYEILDKQGETGKAV
jgi:FlaA1/EpsC-like NDP-sugar epimerase